MDKKEINIHKLIKELVTKEVNYLKCKHDNINSNNLVKILTSNAFEILLKKKCIEDDNEDKIISSNPLCHLLAWQYKESHNETRHKEIGDLIANIKKSKLLDSESFSKAALFLLLLEKNEKYNSLKASKKSQDPFSLDRYNTKKILPTYQIESKLTLNSPNSFLGFNSKIFTSKPALSFQILEKPQQKLLKELEFKSNNKNIQNESSNDNTLFYKNENFDITSEFNNTNSRPNTQNIFYRDEGYESFGTEIWPIVSKQPKSNYFSWEYFDNPNITLEKPFLCESSLKTVPLLQTIIKQKCYGIMGCNNLDFQPYVISDSKFVKYVKYMLVGMASVIFLIDPYENFYLKEDISIENLSQEALKSYCTDLIFCGSCFRALNQLCNTYTSSTIKNCGYVFKELCESIKRYLSFYRLAVLGLSDETPFLTLHHKMHKFKTQIEILTKICKVGPFGTEKIYSLPQSSELLSFLYQEVLNVTDRDLALVLYSCFYPCCQIYLKRFLQQWLYEGTLVDPYEEFMIKLDEHYIKNKTRAYWTKNFSLKQNALPEFLLELKNSILLCGKTMNLLKLCKPDTPLCRFTIDQSNLVTCCLTSDQLNNMKQNASMYYVEMATLCGPRISLSQKLRERDEEHQLFLSKVKQKQALTLQRIELEKQRAAEEKVKQKRRIYEELQNQIRLAREQKKKEREDELKYDLMIAEQNAQLEAKKAQLMKEETKKIIKYYDELFKAIEKRKESIEQHKYKFADTLEDRQNKNANRNQNASSKDQNPTSKDQNAASKDQNVTSKDQNITSKDQNVTSKDQNVTSKDRNVTSENGNIENSENVPKNINLDENLDQTKPINLSESSELISKSSEDVFYDVENENETQEDVLNANLNKNDQNVEKLKNEQNQLEIERKNALNDARQEAKRNRAKIMNLEFGVTVNTKPKREIKFLDDNENLTEAQKNKLKVMRAEYQMYYTPNTESKTEIIETEKSKTEILDKTFNSLASPGQENVMNINYRNNILSLPKHIEQINNRMSKSLSTNTLSESDVPMSISSTPNTEAPSDFLTPCSSKMTTYNPLTLNSATIDTASTNFSDDGFKFPIDPKPCENIENSVISSPTVNTTLKIDSKIKIKMDVSQQKNDEKLDSNDVLNSNIKYLLYQSIYVPLQAQMKLVNNEILKFFLDDKKFFSHLHSLRCYFFLLDGEFGRRITEGIFNKLYEVRDPIDMLNGRCLQIIMNKALGASSKVHENSERLSFTIQNIPHKFNLSSADVLDCLSMSYKINWPLNILLPYDTMEKYEKVFKYLLKLHHVSWILQKTFQELKVSCWKGKAIDFNVLIQSRQYHRLQLYRHVMTNFIQTLQNYTVSEVIQASWEELQHNMESVSTLDQLYTVHIIYLKTIIFRCLLNKQCEPIMKVINEIFVVILKFYNQLRSKRWRLSEDHEFIHPSYKKLEDIFNKFEEYANFVFKVGHKMARVGYQPHLVQMLDMLDMNSYYTNKNKNKS